jgi:WD40 repeat protein
MRAARLPALAALAFLALQTAFALDQTPQVSGVPVLAITRVPGTDRYLSAGKDGFVSLFGTEGFVESWQLSTLPIKAIAVHPDGNRIAVYESDGFSVNRVSVWDWRAKTRIYAKRFRDAVISLSWSAKGSWLLIGNTSIEGITILDSARGTPERVFTSAPGIVSLALTGASESSMITFGPSGTILYTDTASGKERARYAGEQDLAFPVLLANNARIAGYRDGAIVELDATTGQTLEEFGASDPVMATAPSDTEPVWVERSGNASWVLRSGAGASKPFALGASGAVTSASVMDGTIIVGTSTGDLFALQAGAIKGSNVSVSPIAQKAIRKIDDIASDGSQAFILSSGSVYSIESPGSDPVLLFSGVPGNRLAVVDSQLILWSDRNAGDVLLSTFDGSARRPLYKAREGIRSLTALGTSVAFVEGTSAIRVIDTALPTSQFSSNGIGLQDTVLIDKDKLVVSKSSTDKSPNAINVINMATGETVPLPFKADLCYGLRLDDEKRHILSGFAVRNGETATTELITLTLDFASIPSSAVKTALSYADEDSTATALPSGDTIYTNLGKGPFVALNARNGDQRTFERTASLPVRCALLERYAVTLNANGTLSWYERAGGDSIGSLSLHP